MVEADPKWYISTWQPQLAHSRSNCLKKTKKHKQIIPEHSASICLPSVNQISRVDIKQSHLYITSYCSRSKVKIEPHVLVGIIVTCHNKIQNCGSTSEHHSLYTSHQLFSLMSFLTSHQFSEFLFLMFFQLISDFFLFTHLAKPEAARCFGESWAVGFVVGCCPRGSWVCGGGSWEEH